MPIEKEVVEKEWIDGKERIVLNGDIVLSERISEAGKMSNGVYLATGRRLDKNWAVKVVNKTPSENGVNYAECVRDEARVLRKLEHPSIVRVTDVLQDQQAVYVVMDYIEGETLQERVMREGPQPQELVLEWAKQIADALGYVHSQFGDDGMPLVHRDLKAENIMVRPDNSVRVIDFGIAHIAGFGTKGYAAPEQCESADIAEVDGRADIYALGMTMHFLLTGQDPQAPDYQYLPIREWDPTLHEGLENIIERCVQQSPDDRFQTCDELLYALNHYEQESNAFRARQKKKLVTALATAGTGVLLLLVGLGAFIAGKADVRANYERLVNASSYGYAQCQEAMEYDSTRLEALNRLVDSYETQGVFDLEQSKELTQAYNEYTGAKNTPEYLETCFQIGTLYMNFYTENGNQSLLACTRKAYDYFEQIESAGDGKKLSRFEHSSAAHNYYVISKFYKESGGLKLETRRSAQDLEQLLGAFSGCMDYLDTVMRSGQEEDCLRQCMRLADAVNELRSECCASGVDQSVLVSLLTRIQTQEAAISLSQLQDMRARALDTVAAYLENVAVTYSSRGEAQGT